MPKSALRKGEIVNGPLAANDRLSSSIYPVNSDGTGLRKIGSGLMPTFSPDGKRLAFSGGGMSIMDIECSNTKVVSPDGWGAQWSPNGKWIAYESRRLIGKTISSNITLIDVETQEKRTVLKGD